MKKCSGCGKYFDDKYDVCPSCGQICPVVNVVDLTKVKRYHFNFIHNKKIWITVAAVIAVAVMAVICIAVHRKPDEAQIIRAEDEDMVEMPDLSGLTYDEAYSLCRMQLLYVEIKGIIYDTKEAPGVIATQSVEAGRNIAAGSVIYVNMSGVREVKKGYVPDVMYMSLDDAKQVLSESGLQIDVRYEFSDSVAKGYVTSQMPAAKDKCKDGDKVTITVSGEDK